MYLEKKEPEKHVRLGELFSKSISSVLVPLNTFFNKFFMQDYALRRLLKFHPNASKPFSY